jgi:hypothetical protein
VPEMRGRWGGEKRIRRQSQGVRYRQLQSKDRKERQYIRRVSRSWRYTITDYRPILTATAAMAELGGTVHWLVASSLHVEASCRGSRCQGSP